jgi:hypothetical protein
MIHVSYDWDEKPPASAVVEAVAMSHGKASTAFEPLYDVVDPDALNQLLHSFREHTESDGTVSFEYADRHVTIDCEGEIVVSNRT